MTRVAAWLLVGGMLTIASAWMSACWARHLAMTLANVVDGTRHDAWPFAMPDTRYRQMDMSVIPRWCQDRYITGWWVPDSVIGPGANKWGEGLAEGVPFRALGTFSVRSEGAWPQDSEFGIVLPIAAMHRPTLPLYPLWPGFALNTLFYAALAWGVWQVPLVIRRRRRRSKGKCVRCGYDLKGLGVGGVCPECGNAS